MTAHHHGSTAKGVSKLCAKHVAIQSTCPLFPGSTHLQDTDRVSRPPGRTATSSGRPGQHNIQVLALPPVLCLRPGSRARTPSCASARGAAAGAGGPALSGAWPRPSHAATRRPGLCCRREAVGALLGSRTTGLAACAAAQRQAESAVAREHTCTAQDLRPALLLTGHSVLARVRPGKGPCTSQRCSETWSAVPVWAPCLGTRPRRAHSLAPACPGRAAAARTASRWAAGRARSPGTPSATHTAWSPCPAAGPPASSQSPWAASALRCLAWWPWCGLHHARTSTWSAASENALQKEQCFASNQPVNTSLTVSK